MNFSFAGEELTLWWVGALLAALMLAWLVWLGSRRRQSAPGANRMLDSVDTVIGWPPEATRLLTHRHRRAYGVLRQAMSDHMIFAQVPLSRFVSVPTRLSYAEWLRRVGHMCVDLLVCDHASNVVAVIEVRETGHGMTDRARKRQRRLERVLRAAGLPLQVWDEAWLPDPVMVRKTLLPDSDEAPDLDAATVPMEMPEAPGFGGAGEFSTGEPPRTTWFDEADATRPASLDHLPVRSPTPGGFSLPHTDPALQRR